MTHESMPGAPFWKEDELEAVAACPACHAAEATPGHAGVEDHLEGVPGSWNFRRCVRCGTYFLDPRPRFAHMGKAYRSYYTHVPGAPAHQQDNGATVLWRLANGYLNARYGAGRTPALAVGRFVIPLFPVIRQQLDFFYRHLPATALHVLDVGCGNGVFLLRARDAHRRVTGLEPDPVAAAAAREAGLEVVDGTLDTYHPESAFDLVTASNVIEHVHSPHEFLRQILKTLVPGGTIWLATPNADSLGHKWYGPAWRGLEPPRHISIFSGQALRTLLENAGYESITFHHRGRGARYILQCSRDIAEKQGRKMRPLPPVFVDMASMLVKTASEELVVTARKPAA